MKETSPPEPEAIEPSRKRRLGILVGVFVVLLGGYLIARPRLAQYSQEARELSTTTDVLQRTQRQLSARRMASRQRKDTLRATVEAGLAGASDYAELAALVSGVDPDEALEFLQAGIKKHPRSVSLWASLATLQQSQGRMEATLDAFERANALEPSNRMVASALANAYTGIGWAQPAREVLDRLGAASNQDPGVALARARLAIQTDDLREALDLLGPLQAGDQEIPIAWVLAGQAQLAAGEHQAAVAAFEKALLSDLANPSVRLQLMDALGGLEGEEDRERRLRLARELLEEHPEDDFARRALGLTLAQQGEAAEALSYLLPLADETEGDEALLSACVRSLRRTGQNDQAQTYENRLREAREQSERLRRLQSRADLSPSDAEALMALAGEYRQRGNPVMARLEARRVLKIHPNHAAARRLMDEVTLPAS